MTVPTALSPWWRDDDLREEDVTWIDLAYRGSRIEKARLDAAPRVRREWDPVAMPGYPPEPGPPAKPHPGEAVEWPAWLYLVAVEPEPMRRSKRQSRRAAGPPSPHRSLPHKRTQPVGSARIHLGLPTDENREDEPGFYVRLARLYVGCRSLGLSPAKRARALGVLEPK